jgi:hypothetical protein
MALTQIQAQTLIEALKEAVRKTPFTWEANTRYDEPLIAIEQDGVEFILTLNRNPFEIRLHLRTRMDNIGLCRIDAAPYHSNPDGTELRNTPHMHVYREGYGDKWAEPIDWYNADDPQATLERFLDEINARFPNGFQTTIL